MTQDKPILERAFEIARSGECANLPTLRKALKRAGYTDSVIEMHLTSSALRAQLSAICREAYGKPKQHA